MKSKWHISLTCIVFFSIIYNSQAQEAQQNSDSLYSGALNLMNDAGDWSVKGSPAKAKEFYAKAINSLIPVLENNSRFPGASAALAHCYYEMQQYNQSVTWYVKSLSEDSTISPSLAELGLSFANLGNADSAVYFLRSAARHENDEKFQKSLSSEIVRLSEKIQGKAYETAKKDVDKGNEQYWVALKILMVAFDMDPYRNEVAKNISDLGFRLNDYDIASKYLKYSVR
ncbi:MAG: hypothetical protein C5B52_02985 [Bacteroidetes bacterium]|nr:MAG: hypothetical protein C5B52_02985 [Bacteroidota bacterium]